MAEALISQEQREKEARLRDIFLRLERVVLGFAGTSPSIPEIISKEILNRTEKAVKEAFRHLSDEDLLLAKAIFRDE